MFSVLEGLYVWSAAVLKKLDLCVNHLGREAQQTVRDAAGSGLELLL